MQGRDQNLSDFSELFVFVPRHFVQKDSLLLYPDSSVLGINLVPQGLLLLPRCSILLGLQELGTACGYLLLSLLKKHAVRLSFSTGPWLVQLIPHPIRQPSHWFDRVSILELLLYLFIQKSELEFSVSMLDICWFLRHAAETNLHKMRTNQIPFIIQNGELYNIYESGCS